MSVTKELIEQENLQLQTGNYRDVHLHKEGSFLRAYDWSAWLCCHYLHNFKVNKRAFKGIDEPVAYIGFPETSLQKWLPEGAEQRVESEKYLVIQLPDSYLGLLSHYKSYHLRQAFFRNLSFVYHYGYFHNGITKFVLYPFFT